MDQPGGRVMVAPLPAVDFGSPAVQQLIRRIFFHRFSARVRWAGIDPEDMLQDIYVGLLVRSHGKSAWNPSRGALSTWIYVAISGMVINAADKARRRNRAVLGTERDVADSSELESGAFVTDYDVEELANTMDVPKTVLVALMEGGDPVIAAMEGGLAPYDAVAVAEALGCR